MRSLTMVDLQWAFGVTVFAVAFGAWFKRSLRRALLEEAALLTDEELRNSNNRTFHEVLAWREAERRDFERWCEAQRRRRERGSGGG